MSFSEFARERTQAYADHVVAVLLIAGGDVAVGFLVNHYALVWGLDPRVALVLAWVIALVVFISLSLLLKPKQKSLSGTETKPGIVNAPYIEFKPHIEVKPVFSQTQSQEQSQKQTLTELSGAHEPKTSNASKISFELTGLNAAQYEDGVQYMLPRFKYKTGVGHSPKVEVKANLTVWDDDSLRLDEYPGVWHLSKIRSKRFSSGDSADLVLGLASDKGMVGYEYNLLRTGNGKELSPKLTELNGKQFYVLVIFIGRTDEDVLFEKRQWFGVIAGPKPKFIGLLKPPSHIW